MARDLFWSKGYHATTIADLEAVTGLNRSSLYSTFGSKRGLFDRAIEDYLEWFVAPLLAAVEADGATPADAAELFASLAEHFRRDAARRGCLMTNSIAELAGSDEEFTVMGVAYMDRCRRAFLHAFRPALEGGLIAESQLERRAATLVSAMMGAWLAARADPAGAARTCSLMVEEIADWSPEAPI